ncbi:S1 family peptidase [Paraburkholderia oxyphila]|uniref:S1 family peptidase n=1 Tax=Paraburkholderia oxyphila TaxID=614212 RepID=UPI0005B94222|nr:serine protease [Paraburkholderia oxyphila]
MKRGYAALLCMAVAAGLCWSDGEASVPPGRGEGTDAWLRSGTGFFVTYAGELLTSAHVVRGCERIEVWPTDAASGIAASLESIDERLDVALLATHRSVSRVAVLGGGPVSSGASVFTIGFALTPSTPLDPVITRARAVGTVRSQGRRLLVLRARLYQGNSGGPVIDERGTLVGMVIGRYVKRPGMGVAVCASELARFLAGALRNSQTPMARASNEDPDKELQGIAALVQCVK